MWAASLWRRRYRRGVPCNRSRRRVAMRRLPSRRDPEAVSAAILRALVRRVRVDQAGAVCEPPRSARIRPTPTSHPASAGAAGRPSRLPEFRTPKTRVATWPIMPTSEFPTRNVRGSPRVKSSEYFPSPWRPCRKERKSPSCRLAPRPRLHQRGFPHTKSVPDSPMPSTPPVHRKNSLPRVRCRVN